MIGTTVLQYEIVDQLGEGGMGIVYKAKDTKLDRFVALKFLTKNIGSSESDRQRFLQEAKSAATLNHPNICTVYDVSEFEGKMFIAMEFIDGETLRDRKSNISFKQSIDIGIQIAEALAAAHEKGIIHRDIKPENVMLRKDGLVQIMDFGLAKQQGVSRLTREGNTVGTMGYMSPEQVQGFNVDHRSDIFSFGVLLYELLSGQSPFKGLHETAIIYEIVNVDPEPISIIKPELPPDVDAILLECLAKEPDERYQSAKEIVKDLRKLKRESSRQTASRILAVRKSQISSGSQYIPQTTEYETVSPKKNRSINVWMIVAVVFIILCGAAISSYFLYLKSSPELLRVSFESPPGQTFNNEGGGSIEISPDGQMIAFVATDSLGKDFLWVRHFDSSTPILISGTENAQYPFWSFDSKMIAYFAGGKLKKIDAIGGPSFTICEAGSGRGGSWNEHGVIIFAPNSGGPLHQVSASGGVSKQLTVLDSTESETNHRFPYFLPDGEHFFYTVQTSKPSIEEDADHIRIGSLNGTINKIVLKAASNVEYNDGWVIYHKQNTLLAQKFNVGKLEVEGDPVPILENILFDRGKSKGAFTLSRNNRLSYLGTSKADVEMDICSAAGVVEHIMKSKITEVVAAISNDHKFVVTDAEDQSSKNSDLWVHDIARNSDTRLTFDQAIEYVPVFSPDDSRIYFSSNRSGPFNIYVKNSNGTGNEQLVFGSSAASYITDITRDESKLLLAVNTQGNQKWDVGLYDIGEKKFTPLLTTNFNEWMATFSPDGKYYAYQSDETGKNEIYVRPLDGSPSKWQISANGGLRPRWLLSGKEIVYNRGNQEIISTAVNVSGDRLEVGESRTLFKLDVGFQSDVLSISVDGSKIMVKKSLNAQSLRSAALMFNWQLLVENK